MLSLFPPQNEVREKSLIPFALRLFNLLVDAKIRRNFYFGNVTDLALLLSA